MNDDVHNLGLAKSIAKWEEIFKKDLNFSITLANHLLNNELKYQAVREIYKLTSYKTQLEQI